MTRQSKRDDNNDRWTIYARSDVRAIEQFSLASSYLLTGAKSLQWRSSLPVIAARVSLGHNREALMWHSMLKNTTISNDDLNSFKASSSLQLQEIISDQQNTRLMATTANGPPFGSPQLPMRPGLRRDKPQLACTSCRARK